MPPGSNPGVQQTFSKSKSDTPSTSPRTIVIGAGVSGLACARELRQRRHDVLVLEARHRVGGRLKGASLGGSSEATTSCRVDIGGALIHGIENNPVYEMCQHMDIPTRPVSSTLLMDQRGWQIDRSKDQHISRLFNRVLEETFADTQQTQQANNGNFGDLFYHKAQPHLSNMSSEDQALFEWHKQNLEVSCGASFGNLGYQWNEDEPYGYDGAHVAVQPTWSQVMDQLKGSLNIKYGAQVKRIQILAIDPNDNARVLTNGTNTTHQETGSSSPQRRAGSSPNTVRRSSRSNKGVRSQLFSISDCSSMSYDDSLSLIARRQRPKTVVHVTLANGTTLKADSVVCTLPLGVLKVDPNEQQHGVEFDPPLPPAKREAISRLGCGLLNKCAIMFSHAFWQNDDFLGLVDSSLSSCTQQHFHLVVNHNSPQPVLVFWFGGDFAKQVQDWTDDDILQDCLQVLEQATGKVPPTPLDYIVTRWGYEPFSRGAFVYLPPGVSCQDLAKCAEPILCQYTQRPVLSFAGEHTTPYHPSTIHGAYSTGIREAYRLDLAVAPEFNNYLAFSEDAMYKRTFSVKQKSSKKEKKSTKNATKGGAATTSLSTISSPLKRKSTSIMTLRKRPRATPSNNRVVGNDKDETSAQATEPLRKSHRSTAGRRFQDFMVDPIVTTAEQENGVHERYQDDLTLVRVVESYGKTVASWRLIQSKMFPTLSVGQLKARYQKLTNRKEHKPKHHPQPANWDSWVVPKAPSQQANGLKEAQSRQSPRDSERRKSLRRTVPRVILDV